MSVETRPRVHNMRAGTAPDDAIYVGRPSTWGNPFRIGRDGSRSEVVERYRAWLTSPEQADLLRRARCALRGHDLICWCAPASCHADVLLELVNE